MKTVISNLEKSIKSLKKEQSKHDINYRKTGSGYSYGMACEIGAIIRQMEDQIKSIQDIITSIPA